MTSNPPPLKFDSQVISKPLLTDYVYVANRLPQDQQRQWEALSGETFDPDRMALSLAARLGPKWCLLDRTGMPLAIGGYDMVREGVWHDWLIGTEDAWRLHWRSITKHCRRIMDMMLESEAHRLQTVALADRVMAHKWFEALGMRCEGTLRGYGYAGEDCVMYARVEYRLQGPPSWLTPEILQQKGDEHGGR